MLLAECNVGQSDKHSGVVGMDTSMHPKGLYLGYLQALMVQSHLGSNLNQIVGENTGGAPRVRSLVTLPMTYS